MCVCVYSIERDALLLANRIALLKQEEMKTWKKIDDTKKRTNEILTLKKRNEERITRVSLETKTQSIRFNILHFSNQNSTKQLLSFYVNLCQEYLKMAC